MPLHINVNREYLDILASAGTTFCRGELLKMSECMVAVDALEKLMPILNALGNFDGPKENNTASKAQKRLDTLRKIKDSMLEEWVNG